MNRQQQRQRRRRRALLWLALAANVPQNAHSFLLGSSSPLRTTTTRIHNSDTEEPASFLVEDSATTSQSTSVEESSFGQVVPLKQRPTSSLAPSTEISPSSEDGGVAAVMDPASLKRRNVGVAILSIVLAASNYLYQFSPPGVERIK